MKPQGSTVLSLPTHVDPALKELNNTNLLKYAGVFSLPCVCARACACNTSPAPRLLIQD